MVGLLILNHLRNITDESIVDQWQENVYYQYFCWEEVFSQKQPNSSTELVKFRKRIKPEGIELIFKESIRINGKDGEEKEAIIDTTVQEKHLTYPTDAKLHEKIVAKCHKIAGEQNSWMHSCFIAWKFMMNMFRYQTQSIQNKLFGIDIISKAFYKDLFVFYSIKKHQPTQLLQNWQNIFRLYI